MNHSIDVIVVFDSKGKMRPFKFKYEGMSIKVERIMKTYTEKLAGNERIIFVCMHNGNSLYELKYALDSHKWFLFKK